MANEVEIEVVIGDSSIDPALAALRAKIGFWAKTLPHVSILDFNAGQVDAQLSMLKSKLQSHKIADLLDININPGQIEGQLLYLRRKIESYKIGDFLDINLSLGQVMAQMAEIQAAVSQTEINIPVSLNVDMSELVALESMSIGIGVHGGGGGAGFSGGSVAAIVGAIHNNGDLISHDLIVTNSLLASGFAAVVNAINNNGDLLSHDLITLRGVGGSGGGDGGGGGGGGGFGFGRFGFGRIPLFGGLATIGGLHLLIDALVEVAVVVGPALLALGAFGAAAASDIQDVVTKEQQLHTVSTALGKQMPGLTGAFAQTQNAVKPQVYALLGEALGVINSKTGIFNQLATGTGAVLDQLGARIENALGSKGLNGLILTGVSDFHMLGDIVGNVLGVIGNLLKSMPGYAQALFHGLLDVTGGLEKVTGSGFVQGLLRIGIGFHGMWLYGGLAASAVYALRGPITTTGSALTTAGLAVAAWGQGIIKAEGATGKLTAAFGFLTRVPVWGWVAIGAGALVGLIVLLGNVKDSTQRWTDSLQQNINQQTTIDGTMNATQAAIWAVNQRISETQKFNSAGAVSFRYMGSTVTQTYSDLVTAGQQFSNEQATQASRMAQLVTEFGSLQHAEGIATLLHINLVKAFQSGGSVWQQDTTAMLGYTRAVTQMAGFTGGQALAAQNALAFATNDQLTAIQQVTQAEDTLMNVILAGPQAYIAFQQAIVTLSKATHGAAVNFAGLRNNALTAQSDFYTGALPAAQKVIDALQQQQASTSQLTKVIATQASELLVYAGKNKEAKAVIISLINNALGPGTVSMQSLNKWVNANKTSLAGMNAVVAQSTIKAGSLAYVLESSLNAQFHNALLQESGADAQLKLYTKDIIDGTTKTAQGEATRQRLITDLENSGLSAKQARTFVDNLQSSIDAMHGKTVGVGVVGSGSGKLTFAEQALGQNAQGFLEFHAAGGPVGKGQFGGGDKVLAMLEPGEAVIDKWRTKKYADWLKMMGVPGFQRGGIVGNPQSMVDWMSGAEIGFDKQVEGAWAKIAYDRARSALLADVRARARRSTFGATGGPGGGNPAANAALARAMFHPSVEEWVAWNFVAMAESGWNQFADNPTSGAYGIPQALPFTKMPKAAWPASAGGSSNPRAQISWMWDYMWARWGGPIGAAVNEAAHHWYGNGFNGVFNRPTVIGVGERGAEHVQVTPMGRGGTTTLEVIPGGQGLFEQFMARFMKNFVRIHGGGDPVAAFKGYR